MKRLITATALAVAASLAQATPVYHPPGSNLTYGAVSNGQSIMSDITNPAAGAAVLKKEGNQYRFGVLGSVGVGVEFGEIDDLYDKIDTQANIFANGAFVDPLSFTTSINDVVGSVNSVLRDVASPDAYAKVFASVHMPLMPLVVAHQALGGSIVFDVNGSLAAKLRAMQTDVLVDAAQLQADIIAGGAGIYTDTTYGQVTVDATDPLNPILTIDNDSAVIAQASRTAELAMGYSRPVTKVAGGTVYGGLRGKFYRVGLARASVRLGSLIDGAQQALDDASSQSFVTDSSLGLDVGALWVGEHVRLGATLANINEPSFDFGDVSNIAAFTDPGILSQLRASNSFTMEKQLSFEAAVHTANQNWVISGGLDANAIEDALGDEYQWATVSAAYATDTWWLPGVRAGIRKNMAGTKVNYYTFGTTLSVLNIDVAWSSDTVTIDGSTVPRGAILNLGLEVSF